MWIETKLQNRFQLKCEMEFGILGLDDGLPGFSGWKRKLGLWTGDWEPVHLDSSLMRDWVKIAKKYVKFQSVEGIKITHVSMIPIFGRESQILQRA